MERKGVLIRNYDSEGNLISIEYGKCHKIKNKSEFSKCKSKKDGIGTICKECDNKRCAKYYEQNTDKIREQQKEYYEQNTDKIKEYYEQNADKIREQQKEYYEQNTDKIREQHKEYRKQNVDKIKEYYEQNADKIREQQKEYYNSKAEQSLIEIKAYVEKDPEIFNYDSNKEIYGIIYLVYNNKSQRYYVGQTTNSFDIRYQSGWLCYHGYKDTVKEDLEKYGEDSFEYTKIFKVAHNQEELDKLEAYYIKYFDSYENGYNETRGNIFTERGKNN